MRTCSIDMDLFWAGHYPILLGLVFPIFQWLIHSWLPCFPCVCLCTFLFVFLSEKKKIKNLSTVTASGWTLKCIVKKIRMRIFAGFLQCCYQGEKSASKSSCSQKKQSARSMKHAFVVSVCDFI